MLNFSLLSYTQIKDYEIIDSIVRNISVPKDVSINELPRILSKPFRTKTEKVCAIYCWMAQNIEYDYIAYRNNSYTKYSSDSAIILDTYENRKGVCSGYSHLFKFLLSKLKIQAEVITGYGRGDLRTLIIDKSNHAWNAVEINKEWKLFDVTWARDTVNKKTDFFWFMTKPELFIATHYPNEDNWRLLQKPVTLKSFLSFPIVTPKYFELGFSETFPTKGKIERALGDNLRIYFKPHFECLVLPRFYNLTTGQKEDIELKVAKDNSYIDFKFTKKGSYAVPYSILIQDEHSAVIYSNILIFHIIIK